VEEDLSFLEEHHDVRGSTLVFRYSGKDYLIVFTKAGYFRGGEIHEGYQQNVILSGIVEWTTPDETTTHSVSNVIFTTKNTPHLMTSVTDSLIVEWREKPLENPVNYYNPYRDIIKAKMEGKQ